MVARVEKAKDTGTACELPGCVSLAVRGRRCAVHRSLQGQPCTACDAVGRVPDGSVCRACGGVGLVDYRHRGARAVVSAVQAPGLRGVLLAAGPEPGVKAPV